jgi:CysZ protein
LQYLDYGADIDQVGFRDLRQRAAAQRWQSMGFGFSALAASAIPILNLLLLPATVIGGTLLWIRSNRLQALD